MASLVNCKACNAPVSKNAPTCPQCGEPIAAAKKPPKQYSLFSLIMLIALGVFIFNLATPDKPKSPPKPKTPEEIRKAEIMRGFNAWDGSHVQLERWVKGRLRDPESYEHIETRYIDKGDHLVVYTKYRARNGFGGMNVEDAVARANIDGSLIKVLSPE